jgi:acyl-CoA reductase-like NAD-dependent aldehyde dehydrogenase
MHAIIAMNSKSTMGTVISSRHLQRIESMINRTGGKIIAGGERMLGKSELDAFDFSKGCFFPPTIISEINSDDELWKEEVFGPVVVVRSFSVGIFTSTFSINSLLFCLQTEEEGVKLANDCKYGLGAGIWTTDLSRAHRVAADIQAGLCWINTHHRNDPSSPWCMFLLLASVIWAYL